MQIMESAQRWAIWRSTKVTGPMRRRRAQKTAATAKRTNDSRNGRGVRCRNTAIRLMFKAQAKVDILHVPYKGRGPAISDLMGGQTVALMESLPTAISYFTSGKMRPLAVSEAERSPSLPDVPAWPTYDLATKATLSLDAPCRVVNDPCGETGRLWQDIVGAA